MLFRAIPDKSRGTRYYLYKNKLTMATAGNKYNVVICFSEQYLIRAEARAQQNKLAGAAEDIKSTRWPA